MTGRSLLTAALLLVVAGAALPAQPATDSASSWGGWTAVVDRIEGRWAVLVVDTGRGDLESVIPRDRLPSAADRPDAVLRPVVRWGRSPPVAVRVDPAATAGRAAAARARFDRLAVRPDAGRSARFYAGERNRSPWTTSTGPPSNSSTRRSTSPTS